VRRVVLDCGVFVSALITPSGVSARLLDEVRAGVAEPILSPLLLDELEGVLERDKFRSYVGRDEAQELIGLLRREFTVVPDAGDVRHPRSNDPDDDYLVALAKSHNAILVSGDKHLLDLAGNGAPVLSPGAFLAAFS
jgi:putative PIN family toxin of toxin-antitoxin system